MSPAIALDKPCSCDRAKWPKCPHQWYVVNRVPKRDGWPANCGGTGRLSISLNKYAKRIGQPTLKIDTKGAAEALGLRVLAEHAAGTLADTMAGRVAAGAATPAAAAVTSTPAAGAELRTLAAAAASYHARNAVGWSAQHAGSTQRQIDKIMRQRVAAGRPPIGEWLAESITSANVERLYLMATADSAPTQNGNSSRQKYRQLLKAIMTEARRLWGITNPITAETVMAVGLGGQTSAFAMRKKRIPVEFEGSIIRVLLTLGDAGRRLAALIVGMIECAARPGEMLAVKVEDVYLGTIAAGVYQLDGWIKLTATEAGARKNGKARTVPLSPRLRTVLLSADGTEGLMLDIDGEPLGRGRYVFGGPTGERRQTINYRPTWAEALLLVHGTTPEYGTGADRANLTATCRDQLRAINLQVRDCRHEAAHRWHEGRWVIERGRKVFQPPIDLRDIAAMMGHANLAQMKVYLGTEQEDAIAGWRRSMGAAAGPTHAPAVAPTVLPFRRATRRTA